MKQINMKDSLGDRMKEISYTFHSFSHIYEYGKRILHIRFFGPKNKRYLEI